MTTEEEAEARVEASIKRSRERTEARYAGKDGHRRLMERMRFLQARAQS